MSYYKMSLVILSSSQSDYEIENRRTKNNAYAEVNIAQGLQQPYNFHNQINPPLRIPANSEVALQSVKINRSSVFTINSDTSYSYYFGEVITGDRNQVDRDGAKIGQLQSASQGFNFEQRALDSVHDDGSSIVYTGTTSMPLPMFIRAGVYTANTLASELERSLRAGISHPDYFLTSGVVEQDDAEENGTGFVWSMSNSGDQATLNRVNGTGGLPGSTMQGRTSALDITSASGGGTGTDMKWDTDDCLLEVVKENTIETWGNSAMLTTYPTSLTNGLTEFDMTLCTGEWRIGFVRPCQNDGRETPSYFDGSPFDFYDYVVEWSQLAGETEKTIKMYQSSWEKGKLVMKEIEYWNTGLGEVTNAQITATTLGADKWATLHWTMHGECMTVQLNDDRGTYYRLAYTEKNFANGIRAVKSANPSPINQCQWTMYPAIAMKTVGDFISIEKYAGTMNGKFPQDSTGIRTGLKNMVTPDEVADITFYPYPVKGTADIEATPGQSYYMRSFVDPNVLKGCINIESRSFNDYDDGIGQKEYVEVDMTVDNVGIEMWHTLCVKPTQHGWDTTQPGEYTCHTDDVSDLFGFGTLDAITQAWMGECFSITSSDKDNSLGVGGSYGWWVCPSFSYPQQSSQSLFVRCNELTHTSHNMGKGIPSKILYQIPRFGGGGEATGHRGTGEMYFAPNEMVYLDLHNVADINFNDLTVDIVDKNETWAKDLVGSTTVVLHFREKGAR